LILVTSESTTPSPSTGLSSGAIGGIVGGVLGGAFLVAVGIIIFMLGKSRGRAIANVSQAATLPGARIKEETAGTTQNVPVADGEGFVEGDIGGRLRYPNQDITTGAPLGDFP
jgi:hypothetical protein